MGAVDASSISIPRKRSLPAGASHAEPAAGAKRSRLELAAGTGLGDAAEAPLRTRPPPPRPPSPVRPPVPASAAANRPLLPARTFGGGLGGGRGRSAGGLAQAAQRLGHAKPVTKPVTKPVVRPPAPIGAPAARALPAPGSKAAGKQPVGAAQPSKPSKPAQPQAVQRALKETKDERAATYQGADADRSNQEQMHSAYTKRLIHGIQDKKMKDGKPGPAGLMAEFNQLGEPNMPYEHQRKAVKMMASPAQKFTVLGHDMGLGKTATALQVIAAELCVLGRKPKVLITVPSATIDQWEDSVADWLTLPRERVLSTSKVRDLQEVSTRCARSGKVRKGLRDLDLVIISRDCLALAFATCYSKQEVVRETERGNRRGVEWLRTPGTRLHPLFDRPGSDKEPVAGWHGKWDIFLVDEAHVSRASPIPIPTPTPTPTPNPNSTQYMRTPDTRRCESHHHLSCLASKRVLLSGTFVVNSPTDLAGICKAGNAPRNQMHEGKVYDMQDELTWLVNKVQKTINREAVDCFRNKLLNRATKKILNLPPIVRTAVNYEVAMPLEAAAQYNEALQDARALKARIERTQGGRATAKDMTQLIAKFVHMQQCIVSPLLAQRGAAAFDAKTEQGRALYEAASRAPTGAFHALRDELEALRAKGHKNIVIAANHVTIMEIVKMWLEREHPEFGAMFDYKGEMSQVKRVAAKKGFLRSARSLMFLSIGAGGVGLHLVPKPEAIIFWGSMPFSPAHVEQAWNRIHRIGQHAPITGKVEVIHLVPHGSVDCAIGTVHGDKQALINLVQEGDDSGFGGDADSQVLFHPQPQFQSWP